MNMQKEAHAICFGVLFCCLTVWSINVPPNGAMHWKRREGEKYLLSKTNYQGRILNIKTFYLKMRKKKTTSNRQISLNTCCWHGQLYTWEGLPHECWMCYASTNRWDLHLPYHTAKVKLLYLALDMHWEVCNLPLWVKLFLCCSAEQVYQTGVVTIAKKVKFTA